jgi:hypothetical protein
MFGLHEIRLNRRNIRHPAAEIIPRCSPGETGLQSEKSDAP